MNSEHLSLSLLEIIEPYEIKETTKIAKTNLVFKEIFYVRKEKKKKNYLYLLKFKQINFILKFFLIHLIN
jgi:hypothetical protein